MKIFKVLYLFVFLLLGIYACGDDGDDPQPPEPPETITEEDVAKNWQVDTFSANDSTQNTQNVQLSFTVGGQYTLLIPGLNTFGSNGSWTLSDDGETIILDDGSVRMNAEIVEIEDNFMILEFISDNYKGQPITYRIRLTL